MWRRNRGYIFSCDSLSHIIFTIVSDQYRFKQFDTIWLSLSQCLFMFRLEYWIPIRHILHEAVWVCHFRNDAFQSLFSSILNVTATICATRNDTSQQRFNTRAVVGIGWDFDEHALDAVRLYTFKAAFNDAAFFGVRPGSVKGVQMPMNQRAKTEHRNAHAFRAEANA